MLTPAAAWGSRRWRGRRAAWCRRRQKRVANPLHAPARRHRRTRIFSARPALAVPALHDALRPARSISRAALRILPAHAAFSALPIRPMRPILSACFFNQCQKFLVAGGAGQRRFDRSAPDQSGLRGDKLAQLRHHALMHRRIADDTAALVGLGLARLELRFDQRDVFCRLISIKQRRRAEFFAGK